MDRMTDNDVGVSGGTTQVHSELSLDATSGASAGGMSGARDRAGEVAGQAKERAGEAMSQARDFASEAAGQAREKASEALSQAQAKLQESGLIEKIEQNPLAALGIAMGVGFLLAGAGNGGNKSAVSKAKNQLKGAVMGGLSAAIAQEARSFVGAQGGAGGIGDMLNSFLGGKQGSERSQGQGTGGMSGMGSGYGA